MTNFCYFFSFENSKSIHIISSLLSGITQADMATLSLSFGMEYEIHIQFNSDKHDNVAEKIFRLNAKSWDNVTLSPTR